MRPPFKLHAASEFPSFSHRPPPLLLTLNLSGFPENHKARLPYGPWVPEQDACGLLSGRHALYPPLPVLHTSRLHHTNHLTYKTTITLFFSFCRHLPSHLSAPHLSPRHPLSSNHILNPPCLPPRLLPEFFASHHLRSRYSTDFTDCTFCGCRENTLSTLEIISSTAARPLRQSFEYPSTSLLSHNDPSTGSSVISHLVNSSAVAASSRSTDPAVRSPPTFVTFGYCLDLCDHT